MGKKSDFIDSLNRAPIVSLEGKKVFTEVGMIKAEKMLSGYSNLDDFLSNASLNDKMKLSHYIYTGQWDEKDLSAHIVKADDKTVRNWGDILLQPYVGIDTRGLIRVDVGIGANFDLIAIERRLDKSFHTWLDTGRQGSMMKSGRMFQELQQSYGKPSSRVGVAKLQAVHDARSSRSKSSDERQSNADTIEPDDPRVEKWLRDQGRLDVRGIDTPKGKAKSKNTKQTGKKSRSSGSPTSVRSLRR